MTSPRLSLTRYLFGLDRKAEVLPSTNGHQGDDYVSLVPIGRLLAFDHRSGFSFLKKLEFLRANEGVNAAEREPVYGRNVEQVISDPNTS
jgi:hypothetical protein